MAEQRRELFSQVILLVASDTVQIICTHTAQLILYNNIYVSSLSIKTIIVHKPVYHCSVR